jgi:hypothetical protein
MKCVARCSDGQAVSVPPYAAEYCRFFADLRDSMADDFWEVQESPVAHEDPPPLFPPRPPPKTFSVTDPVSGGKIRVRFVP